MTDRYEPVRAALPKTFPPLTRIEAQKAADRIWKKFAPKERRNQWGVMEKVKWLPHRRVRRVWISSKPTGGHWKGWGRLIHDISHDVFRAWYRGSRKPHDPLHAKYETDIAAFVAESGWLEGSLRPKQKPKPTLDEKRTTDLRRTEAAIKRWTSKAKRCQTALSKLRAKQRRLMRITLVA